ncbi:hypothetical protein GQX73_g4114 [Xylaria multiplex]|uniref:MutL C-terminal dimerisation domain-containing protein n=1 Tax=Xylaria multiplex TaxID=323545 RepID=A0A7C8MU02_9PEZI|nr:hypothetical protein GQX73_g4114 [Xylaria multiplex]
MILAWDRRVSVSVREPANRWTFSVHGNQTHLIDEDPELTLTTKVSRILYQAQLSDENKVETWVPLRASVGKLSIVGAMSLHPIATKRNQFISIGIRPVSNEHGSNILYEEINRIFSNSSYGVEEVDSITSEDHGSRAKDGRHSTDGFTNEELKGRKGIDRWPMFYIKIHIGECMNSLASDEIDELLDGQRGNLAAIVDVLKAVSYEFLRKYRFRPKRIRNTGEGIPSKSPRPSPPKRSLSSKPDSKSTSATRTLKNELVGDLATTQLSIRRDHSSCLRLDSPFDLWSRVKSGSPQQVPSDKKVNEQFAGHASQAPDSAGSVASDLGRSDSDSSPPLFGPNGSLLRAPFATTDSVILSVDQGHQPAEIEKGSLDKGIRWTNPRTKETSIIDPTTGFVMRSPNKHSEEHGQVDLACRERLRLDDRSASNGNRSEWLADLLSSWENPVFKTTEPQIPSACSQINNSGQPLQPFGYSTWLQGSPEVGPPIQGRVSKAALRNAEIIAQVDRKFIFAKALVELYSREPVVSRLAASLLIIIDQHAADERCRVESLMKDYFQCTDKKDMSGISNSQVASTSANSTARTEILERPLKFDISIRDATQLERMIAHFAHWGIHCHIVPVSQTRNISHRQVEVTRLPQSIAERCRLEPRLLIELIRKEIWKVDGNDHHSTAMEIRSSQGSEATTPHWITRFHGCPEGILDMINSRACRSSIMFNDPLSLEECADLLKRLADCAFPFQCAHGRPSMVPLVDLGDNVTCASSGEEQVGSFRKAFQKWNTDSQKKDNGIYLARFSDVCYYIGAPITASHDEVQPDHVPSCRANLSMHHGFAFGMSYFWKAFNFFEVSQVTLGDDETRSVFENNEISSVCSGSESLFIGSDNGYVRIIGPSWKVVRSFQAHETGRITHMRQVEGTSLLVTVSEDLSNEPVLKVWALDKPVKKTGLPTCLSTISINNGRKQYPISAFTALDDLSQLAVGFANGAVTVIRGDLIHDRGTKQRVVYESEEPITGVEFVSDPKLTTLFLATTSKLLKLVISGRGHGQPPRTVEDSGGLCFANDGATTLVSTFEDYVALVSPPSSKNGASDNLRRRFGGASTESLFSAATLTMVDPQLQIVAHSETLISPVKALFQIWGDLFILTQDGKINRYHEKPLQQRLELLYQRNLFPLAISLAQKCGLGIQQQNVIYRRYGDHLYQKGDYDSAMAQYIKAIDNTEPSQVIRKFLDTQRIHNLIEYLEELHEHHKATADHTTLLLNCYAKLKDVEKLEKFIRSEGDLKFDLETAISMCRQGGYFEQAAYLATKHGENDLVVDILIEDSKRYAEALDFIWHLDAEIAYSCLMKYARVLLENCPSNTAEFFIDYYTGKYKPKVHTAPAEEAVSVLSGKGLAAGAANAVQNLTSLLPLPYMGTPTVPSPAAQGDSPPIARQDTSNAEQDNDSISKYTPPATSFRIFILY